MRKLSLVLVAAAALAVAPAQAADYTVTGGRLDWTLPNHFVSGDPARTWLGYLTNASGPGAANGSASVTLPATMTDPAGTAVTTVGASAARGLDQLYTISFPVAAAGGTYSDTGVGGVELGGLATFVTHGLSLTLGDPQVRLNGLAGALHASGVNASGAPYDRTNPQLLLDLTTAEVKLRADGARVITGIVPTSAPGTVLSGAPAGSRVFFGRMALTLELDYPQGGTGPVVAGSPGAEGPRGAAGPQGPAGARGPAGKSTTIRTFRLKRAPFPGTAKRRVTLLKRGKVLATGSVQRRTLRLGYTTGTKLKGSYVLKSGARRATVKL
jgi:hypothetical protein